MNQQLGEYDEQSLVEKRTTLSETVAKHVTNGKVLLQVWMTDTNSETLEKLKEFGFEERLSPRRANWWSGGCPLNNWKPSQNCPGCGMSRCSGP
ncbi:MAG: hypothetical protein KC592_00465 [Nitrospira sp.]|nr:hypothetical protein [Nitrospira sp.]HBP87033.1 hypothetical protein [Nitrospiraceae bacterium]HNP28107.1 hypothetical protein [Nitrospirales bacterium]